MTKETQDEIDKFDYRMGEWIKHATKIVKKHSPLLSDSAALEVAKISIKSWQDMKEIFSYAESSKFQQYLL